MSSSTHTAIQILRSSDLNPFITPHPYAVARVIEESVLILNRSLDEIQQLNSVGSFIWNCLQAQGCFFKDLLQSVEDEFEVVSSQARLDLIEFIELLETRKLVQISFDDESKSNQ